MNLLSVIGRTRPLFDADISNLESALIEQISRSRILVIGGAGTIGQAVTREFFKRDPKALHVVDISENNMVELVRDIRSSLGYGSGDFQTLPWMSTAGISTPYSNHSLHTTSSAILVP